VQPLQSARRRRIGKLIAWGALTLLAIGIAIPFFEPPHPPVFRAMSSR